MKKIEIFDPAMCCSTGVCGPGVDPKLLKIATLVENLRKAGADIGRHNLSEEPQAYVDNSAVNQVLLNEGAESLPITVVDGEVLKKGGYPTAEELLAWTGLSEEEFMKAMVQSALSSSCGCGCGGGCC